MRTIRCAMCGHHFDPLENSACQSCPLKGGCQLVCCPACGYETVDIEQTRVAKFVSRLLNKKTDTQEQS